MSIKKGNSRNLFTLLGRRVPVLVRIAPALLLSLASISCVTAMGPRQGEYMISVINSGDAAKLTEIVMTPFLVDDILIPAPADAVSYLKDLVSAIGQFPGQPLSEVPLSRAVQPGTIETETFIKDIYPKERIIYEIDHPKGTLYLLIAKGEEGIRLYGIVGPFTGDLGGEE